MTRLNDLEERLRRMEDKSVSDQEQIRRLTETIRRLEKTSGGGATSSSAAERDRQLETTRKNVRDLQDRMYAMERAQKQASKDDSAAGSSSSSLTAKLQKLVREEVEEKLRGTTSTGSGSHEDDINPQDLHEEISHMHRLLLPTVFQHLKVSMKVIRKLCDERWLTEVNGADKDDFALLTGLLQSHERDDVLKETETFFGMEVVEEEAAGGNRGGESRAGSSVGEDDEGGAEKATAGRAGAIAVEGKGGEGRDSGTRGAADAGAGAAAGAEVVNTPGEDKEKAPSRIKIRTAEEIRRAEDDAPVDEIRKQAQQVEAAEGNKSGEGTADGAGNGTTTTSSRGRRVVNLAATAVPSEVEKNNGSTSAKPKAASTSTSPRRGRNTGSDDPDEEDQVQLQDTLRGNGNIDAFRNPFLEGDVLQLDEADEDIDTSGNVNDAGELASNGAKAQTEAAEEPLPEIDRPKDVQLTEEEDAPSNKRRRRASEEAAGGDRNRRDEKERDVDRDRDERLRRRREAGPDAERRHDRSLERPRSRIPQLRSKSRWRTAALTDHRGASSGGSGSRYDPASFAASRCDAYYQSDHLRDRDRLSRRRAEAPFARDHPPTYWRGGTNYPKEKEQTPVVDEVGSKFQPIWRAERDRDRESKAPPASSYYEKSLASSSVTVYSSKAGLDKKDRGRDDPSTGTTNASSLFSKKKPVIVLSKPKTSASTAASRNFSDAAARPAEVLVPTQRTAAAGTGEIRRGGTPDRAVEKDHSNPLLIPRLKTGGGKTSAPTSSSLLPTLNKGAASAGKSTTASAPSSSNTTVIASSSSSTKLSSGFSPPARGTHEPEEMKSSLYKVFNRVGVLPPPAKK